MKKIFIAAIALATLGLTSCELDREPETTLSDTNFGSRRATFVELVTDSIPTSMAFGMIPVPTT